MKKFITLILITISMLICLTACSAKETTETVPTQPEVTVETEPSPAPSEGI